MAKYRILIVDDDEDVRRMLAMTLNPTYETVHAHDGLDALTKLEACEPDVAIIDVMMPMMDGYQLCQAIRKHPQFNNIPVMFLSAFGSKDNAKKSYAVGGNLFMTKPIDPDRVLKNITFTIDHETPPARIKRFTVEHLDRMTTEEFESHGRGRRQPAHQDTPAQPPRQSEPRFDSSDDPRHAHTPPPRSPEAIRAAYAPKSTGGKPRVLVVDDDAETRLLIDLALRDEFEVTKAGNGMEAIERMVDYQPDLLLLDIMMPKMNGYQLLQSIRRNTFYQNLPVVILSAKSTPRDREYASRLGASEYLAKPYLVDDLMGTLRRVTSAPGFVVRPKKLAIEVIRKGSEEEDKAAAEEIEKQQQEQRFGELKDIAEGRERNDDPFSRNRME